MGETCGVCGREEHECAHFSGQLSTMGSTLEETLDCYRVGFKRLQSLYREWQETVDKANAVLAPEQPRAAPSKDF